MEENYCLRWEKHKENFLKTVENFYKKTSLTDVTLACEGKLYYAHKLVLSSCSDYFCYIFENASLRENLIIVLNDIPSRTLEFLLEFMYMGEVNVKQNDLTVLIRAAQYLKIKGLVANNFCFADFGTAAQVHEQFSEASYSTIGATAIKIQPEKGNENATNKGFIIEDPVQMMTDFPVLYSHMKVEHVKNSRVAQEGQEEVRDVQGQHSSVESKGKIKMDENYSRNSGSSPTKGKKAKLHKKLDDPTSSTTFNSGHSIFMPMEGDNTPQTATSQADLLRPMHEINYDKDSGKDMGGEIIFTSILGSGTATEIKQPEVSEGQKHNISTPVIAAPACSVVFEQPIPIQDHTKLPISAGNTVSLNQAMIVTHPHIQDSETGVKEPKIVRTTEQKRSSNPDLKKYMCSECSYSSDFSSNVRRHIRTHTGEKPYKCPLCVNTFASSGRFKSHVTKVHDAQVISQPSDVSIPHTTVMIAGKGEEEGPQRGKDVLAASLAVELKEDDNPNCILP